MIATQQSHQPTAADTAAPGPSSLYQARLWKLGMLAASRFPTALSSGLLRALARLYWTATSHRRKIVISNLLPALNDDRTKAEKMGRRLIGQFAQKLVDLWRFESGRPIADLLGPATGWEHFQKARSEKRGILLLTPHLGNWEFGGPLLTQNGGSLKVITQAEPGKGFTQLRQAARKRWNIETIVVGDDGFGVIEVIRNLEAGETVALLVDRPPARTAMTVQLFGRPFRASGAAAELARATGCALLPVCVPRKGAGYLPSLLPEVPYDRLALRDRGARQELTQRITNVFEPPIREYLDQWYHFVPIWGSVSGNTAPDPKG